MANINDDEEIIILEDAISSDNLDSPSEEKSTFEKQEEKKAKKKRNILLAIVGLVVFFILLVVIIVVSLTSEESVKAIDINETSLVKKIKKPQVATFKKANIEKLIQKANILYSKGKYKEALSIFKEISTYNEALSFYNMGVAKMQEKDYKNALVSFQKAISSGEQVCISSINAAVCALKLEDTKLFDYYIDLASVYLANEKNNPLYSYYLALIHYYKNNYIESLVSLDNPTSKYYTKQANYLSSKLYSKLGNTLEAINKLEKNAQNADNLFTLGLMYAKVGEFSIAKNYLLRANKLQPNNDKIQMALSLTNVKTGFLASAADFINDIRKNKKTEDSIAKIYPIKTILNPRLFDIDFAQQEFMQNDFYNDENKFSLLFYFASYKIYNANKTISYIRKGGINIAVDPNSNDAQEYLQQGSKLSSTNNQIITAIQYALKFDLNKAKNLFEKIVKQYPKHDILNYNLGLIYAQLGQWQNAYKHFSKSYHLNRKMYLSACFALMSARLSFDNRNEALLKEELLNDLKDEKNEDIVEQVRALLNILEDREVSSREYMLKDKKDTLFNLIVDILISKKSHLDDIYQNKTTKMLSIIPKDIIANILHFDSLNNKDNIKQYAKNFQIYFVTKHLNKASLYYGPVVVTNMYVQLMHIAGLLPRVKKELKQKLDNEFQNPIGILRALAYVNLFTKNFQESFYYYNQLIDTYKQQDSQTLFFAAASAIGANNPSNAIALLSLSKVTNIKNFESRFALGLLYQETGNFKGAVNQYLKIGDIGFRSKYFDFEIEEETEN
jgi:tetratricopeptide (TPR) repeat protein